MVFSTKPAIFRRQLRDQELMTTFFSQHRRRFFPALHHVRSVTCVYHPTLSTGSFLMEYGITGIDRRGKLHRHVVRGNSVDPQSFNILQAVARQHPTSFSYPRPLLYLTTQRYELYEAVAGTPARQLPLTTKVWGPLSVHVGRALAEFHRLPTKGLRKLTWSQEKKFLSSRVSTILRRAPKYSQGIRTLGQVLTRAERRLWGSAHALVHNDFQASNIIRTSSGVGFIDFTQSGIGHPAIDLGMFLVHARIMTLGRIAEREVTKWQNQFLKTYYDGEPGWAFDRRTVTIFELRTMLDIMAITSVTLGPKKKAGRKYLGYLARQWPEKFSSLPQP